MKIIPLTKGKFARVSDEDYEWLSQWKWTYHSQGYAYRQVQVEGKKTDILMHRLIMDAPVGMDVDHRDGDRLNNERENLRLATRSQNLRNRRKTRGSSKYLGVSFYKKNNNWEARVATKEGKWIRVGYYPTEEEAHQAREKYLDEHGLRF